MYSNYPDDIRQYDHDPRSPFYDGPETEEEAEALKEAEEYAADAEYDRRRDEQEATNDYLRTRDD